MTPQQNLKDIMNKRILKTKMYSFNEVRDMFKLERQRIKKRIKQIEPLFNEMTRNFDLINKKEVLVLLEGDLSKFKKVKVKEKK